MGKINKIMVACDFSEYSPQVVGFAVELATQLNAALLIVNVINQRDIDAVRKVEAHYPVISVEKYIKDQEQERRVQMDELLAEANSSALTVHKMIQVGVPFRALIQVIEDVGADMLVMGTKGRGNLAGVLFGSTAEKVFRRCPIPLVSLRTEKPAG